MEMKILSVAFLIIFLSWTSTEARKIVVFERSGPWAIRQEISDGGGQLFIKEESHGVVFGRDVQELVPRLAIVKEKLAEGLWRMLNVGPHLSGFPLKETVARKGEGLTLHGSPFQFVCNACIMVSKQAEEVLSNPDTLKNIEELTKNLCKSLPSNFSAQCDEMSQMYIQEAIAMMQDYLSEDKLCISTGLCNGNNYGSQIKLNWNTEILPLDVHDDTTCAVCEQFVEEAVYYVDQNKTRSEILSALHQTCSKLKMFSTECDSLVDYYASLFFMELETVKPKEFCQKISYCSDSSSLSLKLEQNCDLCRAAMSEVKAELEDPETKMKMIEMMLDGCKRVPTYTKECKRLVFEYGPVILTNMEKYLDSNDICSELHVCESQAGKLENKINDRVHPLIELPSSESSNQARLE
uniref:TSA: Wollemia nobilis Ref_Wollemi_Transcript_5758_1687 transcribed RNA sequence n=1 Tax=Wollemia nobilis TaxID=56998 RepID=A0A0C9RXJ5_9CONI